MISYHQTNTYVDVNSSLLFYLIPLEIDRKAILVACLRPVFVPLASEWLYIITGLALYMHLPNIIHHGGLNIEDKIEPHSGVAWRTLLLRPVTINNKTSSFSLD